MTKGELVQKLARQFPGIRREDARIMIDLFLESMKEGLREGDTVELRDFGVLRVRTRSERKARNPRTGTSVVVGSKKVPYFKQSRILKAMLKSKPAE
ncbi:MAG: integration host factor subunit beta [Nitrospirae bacterium]|jgi:nucleoid DNA-binding protein|uniref:Histone family protein DNA-binding protein n=1 Tax=Leptospirillum ferrodiazotrophum TaxID=412449 RepID=C6HV23_9BACT|nr:MAG: histone family protein DNA-binding protein [Leptospirillum ferrodiazotrophum]MCL5954077.1 integration host factor subunit beta [Nitrospirota bacterium]